MIGDYEPDGVVFPHIQVPIFKVRIYFREIRRPNTKVRLSYVQYTIR